MYRMTVQNSIAIAVAVMVVLSLICLAAKTGQETDFVVEPQPVSSQGTASVALNSHLVLTHDFGLTMCGTVTTHEFVLNNDSAHSWTIDSISSDCSCSVVDAGFPVILPREAGRFTFRYRAPSSPKNYAGGVRLTFREFTAPKVRFDVTAMVRNPLTPSHSELQFETSPGGTSERELRIDNFSGTRWSDIEFADLPEWVRVARSRPISVEAPYTQSWLCKLTAQSSGGTLQERFESQFIRVRAVIEHSAAQPPSADIRVTRVITEDYVLTPTSLLLGPMKAGHSKQATVLLRAKSEPFGDTAAIEVGDVEAQPGVQILVEVSPMSPVVVAITGTCSPTNATGIVSGSIPIRLPNGRLIRLPFTGRVAQSTE